MVLIFTGPPVSAPRAVSPWQASSVQWVGVDGSVWDLVSGAEGVVLLFDGVEGLHSPVLTKYSSESRAVPGVRARGWRATSREVFWPVLVYGDSSEAWRDTYARFFNSIRPDVEGVWRVGFGGAKRELRLTGTYDDSHRFVTDPHKGGWAQFGVTLEAAQPYWTGEPVQRGPWTASAPVDFINGTAPPFNIGMSTAVGSATIPNPGDVDAYPVWTVTGPLTGIELGVGTRVINVPFAVDAGEVLVIDTDPRNLTATLDGVDVTADLGFQSFAPIPTGAEVSLHVEATGTGSIRAALTPLYFRAF